MRIRHVMLAAVLSAALACQVPAFAQQSAPASSSADGAAGVAPPAAAHHHAAGAQMAAEDARALIAFPEPMRLHILSNMRDHLLALAEIQEALSRGWLDKAADIAEQRLGMSSLGLHGADVAAPYMPQGMQEIGTDMHRNASRFAVEAINSTATGDLKPALAALARTAQACVACHASYRVR